MEAGDRWLKPGEVASRFRVDPKTVLGWANKGLITCTKTEGGHRRYSESDVLRYLKGVDPADPLLTSSEVAELFGVTQHTIIVHWAKELEGITTPGGQHLYPNSKVRELLRARGLIA